ncbi:growth hormone secretagogue receptor type 1 isoform X1 [Vanessa atalanta]|uniref:growth hormone secretagogue receptor type 1 isoform X1 n=1 Tax=Vanessa atalanta TaxID=42275 RepID=UPI001FCD7EC5|nr:growth hormone secretagogue receptor type 1 isoform X1 [Vanessa atalanta]XP_047539853.1 growth hormone secretagogue receptor type 1 isoform X1 [Vanessa atalanta]XP_047539854.1 growth hormone secretagogue receptor type 1 isoform X1 [Vanessa atalanta]
MISIANFTHTNTQTPIQYNTNTYKNATQNPRDNPENLFERFEFQNATFPNNSISNSTFEMSNNFTEYAEIPYYIKATSMTFCIVIMCLGVIGNVMVPIVILKTKDMRNSTNIFLVNLSIADLMVLLVCTPTVLVEVNSKPETWVLGKELCLAVPFVELTVAHASVLTILAISFERYYAICEPLRAGYVCTKTRATLICALAWFFAALFTSPILGVATFTYERYNDGTEVPVCLTQADTFWSALFFILIIAIFFIIPLGVLLVLYSVIAKNLMENPAIIAQNTKNTNNAGNVLRYRKQVILMLGTVVLSFFICLLPFKALTLWIIVFPPETILSLGIDGYYILLYFCRVMLYLNSAINPILYNLMSSKFREGFVKLLKINKLMRCSRNLRENMQRRDTFNTTTSTGFSSSQNTSDSFWRRYSNRASSQKYFINRDSKKIKEVKDIFDTKVQQVKVGEIINVENTRRNSMKFISALNELNDTLGDIIEVDSGTRDNIKIANGINDVQVEVHGNCADEDTVSITENNKQIQILNLDVKTNNVYSVTLDVSERGDRNRFVCVPAQESKNIFVYDFKSNESFV